jgi:methylmalonyl-CoA/ethylmalonyl-CoA epimerase
MMRDSMKDRKHSYDIAHIAVAVPQLKQALESVEKVLGVTPGHIEEVPDQKVRLQFVEIGGVRFEFLEPTTTDSPISRFIEKRGGGIHHLALYVTDLDSKLKALKEKGIPLIDEVPRIGAEGCRIAFLHPKAMAGILVELMERPK